MDVARGHVMAEDYAGGLRYLQEARRIAPQQTGITRWSETVLAIAAARRAREDLGLFASWLGLGWQTAQPGAQFLAMVRLPEGQSRVLLTQKGDGGAKLRDRS
jgi:hypothetical protein